MSEIDNIIDSLAALKGGSISDQIKAIYNNLKTVAESSKPDSELQTIWRNIANHPVMKKWREENLSYWEILQRLFQ